MKWEGPCLLLPGVNKDNLLYCLPVFCIKSFALRNSKEMCIYEASKRGNLQLRGGGGCFGFVFLGCLEGNQNHASPPAPCFTQVYQGLLPIWRGFTVLGSRKKRTSCLSHGAPPLPGKSHVVYIRWKVNHL